MTRHADSGVGPVDAMTREILLRDPERSLRAAPEAFVEAALETLLDPTLRDAYGTALRAQANGGADGAEAFARAVRDGGLMALSPDALAEVMRRPACFAAVCVALEALGSDADTVVPLTAPASTPSPPSREEPGEGPPRLTPLPRRTVRLGERAACAVALDPRTERDSSVRRVAWGMLAALILALVGYVVVSELQRQRDSEVKPTAEVETVSERRPAEPSPLSPGERTLQVDAAGEALQRSAVTAVQASVARTLQRPVGPEGAQEGSAPPTAAEPDAPAGGAVPAEGPSGSDAIEVPRESQPDAGLEKKAPSTKKTLAVQPTGALSEDVGSTEAEASAPVAGTDEGSKPEKKKKRSRRGAAGLARKAIVKTLAGYAPDVERACASVDAPGKVRVRLSVSARGHVDKVWIDDDVVRHSATGRCVMARVAGMAFPKHDSGTEQVMYTFGF